MESQARWLTDEEVEQVLAVFVENGAMVPDPQFTRFAGVVVDGKVMAFMTFQLVPHCEPTWVHPDLRASGIWNELAEFVAGQASGLTVYCSSADDRTKHMVEKFGMIRVGDLYRGEF